MKPSILKMLNLYLVFVSIYYMVGILLSTLKGHQLDAILIASELTFPIIVSIPITLFLYKAVFVEGAKLFQRKLGYSKEQLDFYDYIDLNQPIVLKDGIVIITIKQAGKSPIELFKWIYGASELNEFKALLARLTKRST